MKQLINNIAFVAAVLSFAACNNLIEQTESIIVPETTLTIRVTREGLQPEARSLRLDDGSVWWNPKEEVSIFYGSGTNGGSKFVSMNTTIAETTELSGSIQMSGSAKDFWAVYPYSTENSCDGSSVTTVIPALQTGVEGNFSDEAFPAVAKGNSTYLPFWNICGGIRFFVSKNDIKSVTIKGNNNEALAGKVKVSFNSDGLPEVTEIIDGQTEVTLNAPDGGSFKPGKYYYITLLPTPLDNGVTLSFITDSEKGEIVSNRAQTVKRSTFGVLKNVDSNVTEWVKNERDIILRLEDTTRSPYTGIEIKEGMVVNVNGESYTVKTLDGSYLGVTVRVSDNYICGYPASAVLINNDNVTIIHPEEISGTQDALYVGTAVDGANPEICLTPVASVVNLVLSGQGADRWDKIVVSSSDAAFSGEANLNVENLSIGSISHANNSVTIKRDLGNNYENDIIIPIFPQVVPDIKIVVYDEGNNVLTTKERSSSLTIEARHVYKWTVVLETSIEASTIADFIATASSDTYYRLSGTVSEFRTRTTSAGKNWMQFTLTDNTGFIIVYGFKDGEYEKWADKIKDYGTAVINGTYQLYTNKNTGAQQHEVMNCTVESFTEGSAPDPGTPSGNGTVDNPYNVAGVIQYIDSSSYSEDAEVYVKGKICSIKNTFDANYGTAIFNISDDGSTSSAQFTCYSIYYLENKSWVNGYTQIKNGDEVIAYGKVVLYSGSVYETSSKNAYIYSLNGVTTAEEVTPPGPGTGDETDFTSNVTWTDGSDSSYTQEANVNGTSGVSILKLGTGSKYGKSTITLPGASSKLTFYAISWNNVDVANLVFTVNGSEVATVTPKANSGLKSNPPYTITVSDSDKYTVDLPSGTTSVTVETSGGYRAALFRIIAE